MCCATASTTCVQLIFRSTPLAATSDERTSRVYLWPPDAPMYTNELEEACHSYDERLGILQLCSLRVTPLLHPPWAACKSCRCWFVIFARARRVGLPRGVLFLDSFFAVGAISCWHRYSCVRDSLSVQVLVTGRTHSHHVNVRVGAWRGLC